MNIKKIETAKKGGKVDYSIFTVKKVLGAFFFVPYFEELVHGFLSEEQRRELFDYLSVPRVVPLGDQYIFHKVDDDSIVSLPEEAEIYGVMNDFVEEMGGDFSIDQAFFRKLSQNNIVIPLGSIKELMGR